MVVLGGLGLTALLLGAKRQSPPVLQVDFESEAPEQRASLEQLAGDVQRMIDHDPSLYFYTDDEERPEPAPRGAPRQLEDGAANDLARSSVFETTGHPVPVE